MRLGVVGDLHIDIDNPRTRHLYDVLDWTLNDGAQRGVEKWVFAGDIIEGEPVSDEWGQFLSRVKGLKAAVVLGNHESYGAIRYWDVADLIVADHEFRVIQGEGCDILLVPYPRRHRAPFHDLELYGDTGTIRGSIDACRTKLWSTIQDTLAAANNKPVVLVGHFTIAGMRTRDTEFELHRPDEVVFAQEDFRGIKLTVTGHIHKAQDVCNSPLIVGVGSLIRQNRAEADDEKSYMIVEISDTKFGYERIPVPAREMLVTQVSVPEDIEPLIDRAAGKEVYVDIVTDEVGAKKFRPSDWDALRSVAASLKTDARITATQRTRVPELKKNVSIEDELDAYFLSIETPLDRIARLKETFAEMTA